MNNYKYLKTVTAGYQDTFLDIFIISLKILYIQKYEYIYTNNIYVTYIYVCVCVIYIYDNLFQRKVHTAIFEKQIFQLMLSPSHHSITVYWCSL